MDHPSRKRTLFVVDDDDFVRDSMRVFLTSGGWTVRTFATATECLEVLASTVPDFVLCDLSMPVMNGAQFVEAACQRHIACPVIVFTGNPDSALADRARAAGAAGVLAKPMSGRQIDAELDRIARGVAAGATRA